MTMFDKLVKPALEVFIIGSFLVSTAAAVKNPGMAEGKPFITKGRVTIQFEDDVETGNYTKAFGKASFNLPSLDALLEQFEVTNAEANFPWRKERPALNSRVPDMTRFWEIYFPESVEVSAVIKALLQNPHVRSADAVWALPVAATPNDPSWSLQWHMEPPGPD